MSETNRGATTTIEQKVDLPAAPEEVYRALLDADEHAAFTGGRATCEAVVGGAFTAHDGYISGEILELVPNRKIVQSWRTTEWPEGAAPSRLELLLEAVGDGTELTMVHSRVPVEQAESYRQGWIDHYWEPLKTYLRGSR